jgi:hypothetical protein
VIVGAPVRAALFFRNLGRVCKNNELGGIRFSAASLFAARIFLGVQDLEHFAAAALPAPGRKSNADDVIAGALRSHAPASRLLGQVLHSKFRLTRQLTPPCLLCEYQNDASP